MRNFSHSNYEYRTLFSSTTQQANKQSIFTTHYSYSDASNCVEHSCYDYSYSRIVTGFQKEIRDKVIGFGSHIQITHFANGNSYDSQKVSKIDSLKNSLEDIDDITHIQTFATKPGIIKTKEEIQGVVLKGVGSDFNPSFFDSNLKAGNVTSLMIHSFPTKSSSPISLPNSYNYK